MQHKVLSLAQARAKRRARFGDAEFNELFKHARSLRDFGPEVRKSGILCLTWPGFSDWMHKQIAERVFAHERFERDTLRSITYSAEILVRYARVVEGSQTTLSAYVIRYGESSEPEYVLRAAESAFLMYVLWPNKRLRRTVHYRVMAESIGPFLFSVYSNMTGRTFGIHMSEAFVPLGDIARDVLYRE